MRPFLIAVLMIMIPAGMALAQANPASPAAAPAAPHAPTPGRYQITSTTVSTLGAPNTMIAQIFMVDTQTGDTWNFDNGSWRYMGNPTKDPGLHNPGQ